MEKSTEQVQQVQTTEQKDAKSMLSEARDYWQKIKEDGKVDGKDNNLLDNFLQTLDQKEKDFDEAKKMLLAEFKNKKIEVLKSMLKNGYTVETESDFDALKKVFKLAGIDYNLGNYSQLKSEIDKTGESTNDGFVIMYNEENRSFEKEGSKLYVYSDIDFGSTDSAGVITKSGKFVKIDSLTAVDDKTFNNNELQEDYGFIASALGEGSYYALNNVGLTITGKLGEHPSYKESLKNGFSGNLAKGIVDGILDMGDAFEKIFTSQEARYNFVELLTSGNFWSTVIESIKQDFKDVTAEDAYIAGKAIPNVLATLLVGAKAVQVTGKLLGSATKKALNMVKKTPKNSVNVEPQAKLKYPKSNDVTKVETKNDVVEVETKRLEHKQAGEKSSKEYKNTGKSSSSETLGESKSSGKLNKLEARLKYQENALKKAKNETEVNQIKADIENIKAAIKRVKKLDTKERGLVTGTNKVEGLQKSGDIVELKGGIKVEKTDKIGGYKVYDNEGNILFETKGSNKALGIKKVEESISKYRESKRLPDKQVLDTEVVEPLGKGLKEIEFKQATSDIVTDIKDLKVNVSGLPKEAKLNVLKTLLINSLNKINNLLTSNGLAIAAGSTVLLNSYNDVLNAYKEKFDLSDDEIKSIYKKAKKEIKPLSKKVIKKKINTIKNLNTSKANVQKKLTYNQKVEQAYNKIQAILKENKLKEYKLKDVNKLAINNLGKDSILDFDGKRVWYRVKDGNGKSHNFYFTASRNPKMSKNLTDGKGDKPLSDSRQAKSLTQWINSKNKQHNIKVA